MERFIINLVIFNIVNFRQLIWYYSNIFFIFTIVFHSKTCVGLVLLFMMGALKANTINHNLDGPANLSNISLASENPSDHLILS